MTLQEAIIQIIIAYIGTVSFSVLFGVSKKQCLYCGITGSFGWSVYLISIYFGLPKYFATFFAAFALTAMARAFSTIRKAPTTLFLLSGIFILVPGADVYYTAYNMFMDEVAQASIHAELTAKLALAIAFGIAMGYILPPQLFGWGKNSTEPTKLTQPMKTIDDCEDDVIKSKFE